MTGVIDPWQELREAADDVLSDVITASWAEGISLSPAQERLAQAVARVDPENV